VSLLRQVFGGVCRAIADLLKGLEARGDKSQVISPYAGGMLSQVVTMMLKLGMCREDAGPGPGPSAAGSRSLVGALEVINWFVRRRWVMFMRSADVALVLSGLAPLPALLASRGFPAKAREEVLIKLCGTAATLLKYQARQLYSCTPPFMALVRGLLRVALMGPQRDWFPPGGQGVKAVARLLEAVASHKANLRRHMLHLIPDFVQALGAGANTEMAPELKATLLPGIYAVMDGLGTEEVQHVHAALLDGTGQALFKKLHADYQRSFKYRGKV
jgi:hypothetical protein